MASRRQIWLLVNCTATDENSEAYSFQFRGDGTPVDVKHPGAPPPSPGHVDQRTITDITRRFKAAMAAGGIRAVAQDLEKCFDEGLGKSSVIRACMLYDISAVNFDKTMRKMFESRGVDVGSQVPFLTDRAFAARMQIYSGMAFAGTEAAAYQFFGTAPTTVINGLSK